MKMQRHTIGLEFITPLLGTCPKSGTLYEEWVASLAPDPDIGELEVADVQEAEEAGWTGFLQNGDGPYLSSHVIRGFCKGACYMLRRVKGSESKKLTAYKKMVDNGLFVEPRVIHLALPEGEEMGVLERGMRVQTPRGERNCLARSDTAPVGTKVEFEFVYYDGTFSLPLLEEWLAHGQYHGIGAWRGSGGKGRFTFEVLG